MTKNNLLKIFANTVHAKLSIKKPQMYRPIMTTTPLLLRTSQEKFYSNRKQRGENWRLAFMKNSLLIKIQQFFLKIYDVLFVSTSNLLFDIPSHI